MNRKIAWKRHEQTFHIQDQLHRFRPLDEKDIPRVVELFRSYAPYLQHSSIHYIFDEAFYREQCCHLSHWQDHAASRLFFCGVLENVETGQIVMTFLARRDPYEPTFQNSATVLEPHLRGKGVARRYAQYVTDLFEFSGAEYAWAITTTQSALAQHVIIDIGWNIGGILPGHIRKRRPDGTYYRDTEVFVYRLFGSAKNALKPLSQCAIDPHALSQIQALLDEAKKTLG